MFHLSPISGSLDDNIRIRNADTHAQIGDLVRGHSSAIINASESADGCQIMSQDHNENTIICNCENTAIAWKSAHKDVLKKQNR